MAPWTSVNLLPFLGLPRPEASRDFGNCPPLYCWGMCPSNPPCRCPPRQDPQCVKVISILTTPIGLLIPHRFLSPGYRLSPQDWPRWHRADLPRYCTSMVLLQQTPCEVASRRRILSSKQSPKYSHRREDGGGTIMTLIALSF